MTDNGEKEKSKAVEGRPTSQCICIVSLHVSICMHAWLQLRV